MAQTHIGAMKVASKKSGCTIDEYIYKLSIGKKWCYSCRQWLPKELFSTDISRGDGRCSLCKICISNKSRSRYIHKEATHHGPLPNKPRNGDKKQARHRINIEVRNGKRPHPNTIPCADCDHVWQEGERRHEYDHYLGYSPENHSNVQVVCSICHRRRSKERGEFKQRRNEKGRYINKEGEIDG
jgi:hypothetical protein